MTLTVSGGNAPYTWSLAADETDATLSSTSGNSVQLAGSADPLNPKLTVSVEDSSDTSVSRDITLDLLNTGPGGCPTLEPTALPAACAQNPYFAQNIVVDGGTAPFTWKALSMPDGLSFDPNTQIISGTANASGAMTPVTLEVEDSNGHKTQGTYPLTYRDKCWFGYASSASGDSKIHLYDPALGTHALSLEASLNNNGVVDFKFSPDGQYLVYRRTVSGSAQDLVLASAPNWQERVLDFGGSVLEYSWSPGASLLAVAFQDGDGNTLVGGLNAAGASTVIANGTALTLLHAIPIMDPTYAPLNSDLTWIQSNQYVAFHADALPGSGFGAEAAYFVHFDGGGFSSLSGRAGLPYLGPIQLQPAKNGVFAIFPSDFPQLDFWGTRNDLDYDEYLGSDTTGTADPEGLYVARSKLGKLDLFFSAESGGTNDPPTPWTPSADSCASILAWNPAHEEIACDAASADPINDPNGRALLYTLDAGTASVSARNLKELSGYQPGDATTLRRAFSPQGDFLVFTSDTTAYVANVTGWYVQTQFLAPPYAIPGSASELSFSPDQTLVLWQLGGLLGVASLQTSGPSHWYGDDSPLQSPTQCAEEYSADPAHWCGSSSPPPALTWAPDSRFAAALTAANTLRVYDFSQFTIGTELVWTEACETGCSSNFAFQP
jgi:WD40 repeat protein